jgi:glycosyltransferase involved in cell wall biosynthesis
MQATVYKELCAYPALLTKEKIFLRHIRGRVRNHMHLTFSILITYFNERELLGECLVSLLAQTRQPDEILIYDDASDAPARDYIPAGCQVRIIRGEVNRGPSYGRNVLLQNSKSDYIHFHDADDLFHANWCERIGRAIEETRAGSVYTEISSYIANDLVCERVLGLRRLYDDRDLIRFSIQGAMLVPAGTYLRKAVLSIGGYREDLCQSEDYDFHVRLAALGLRYTLITDPLVFIRIRPTSRSQHHLEVWASAVQAIARLATELPQQYKTDLAEAAARAGSILFRLGARSEARQAFSLAYEIGSPNFRHQREMYRILAKSFGPEVVELLGALYRKRIPERLRRYLGGVGI